MPIINSIVSWLMTKRMHQIDFFKKYPFDIQQETLLKIIKTSINTEWGKKYDYRAINSIEEFKKRVPLQDYESLKPYINRMRNGENNILWHSNIKWFAKSSGTTSDKSKFIPVSKESLENCHLKAGKDIYAIYTANYPETKIFKGKCLILGGSLNSHRMTSSHPMTYVGDISAIYIKNLPFWTQFNRTPDNSIVLMDEWEEKFHKIAQATINVNVTNMAGVPSWTLVLIKHIFETTGKNNLLEIWPNLELFVHGGVNYTPYREQFKKIIPSDKMNYLETYNATEGFFTIQDEPASDDMLLMLDYGIFYEFIPVEKSPSQTLPKGEGFLDIKTLSLDEVELNTNYALVISTNAGLWRYIIGDTVKFTSKFPFKIKISGRIKHFINAFGEELIIDNAEKALKIACEKTNALISEYTAAPVYMSDNKKGAHQWLIEFERAPENLEYFIFTLDDALKSLNSDYEAKRYKNLTLDMPDVVKIKTGVFYQWLKEKGKLGGQNKVPRLANNRDYVDELLEIQLKV